MPDSNAVYDAVVIGSGMGGLAAAAVLSRLKGYRVLVLEQHFQAGGFTHTFRRPGGYAWDVGLHYVGGMAPGDSTRKAMDFVTGSGVEWAKMKDPFEVFWYPGLKFEVPSDPVEYRQRLARLFPEEQGNLRAYFRDVDRAVRGLGAQWMPAWLKAVFLLFFRPDWALAQKTVKEVLEARFRDPRLKGLLASQWGDYGLPPAKACFGVHAVIVKHYLKGAYYPAGSARSIGESALKIIRDAGGDVKLRHRALRILVEEGRAVGVEFEGPGGRGVVRAREVYSDAGAQATYGGLLEGRYGDPGEREFLEAEPSLTAVSLYLGLKGDCAGLGIHGQNFWMYSDFDHDRVWERRDLLARGEASLCYLSFPGLKDPQAGKPTAEIIAPVSYGLFRPWKDKPWRKRGGDYEELKKRISETLLDFVEERLPGFRKEVAYAELSTPLTVEGFTGHREGNIYGFPQVPRRLTLGLTRARTPVKGLALVGADAGSLGIVGALMGGLLGVASLHGFGIFPKVFRGR